MSDPIRLRAITDLETLIEKSHGQPVVIFKHSLTCPISTSAYREYQRYLGSIAEGSESVHALIEIQNARDVSSAVAERTGVRHESPQALVLREGKVVWHASHWDISADALSRAVVG